MSKISTKWIEAISVLTELTQRGELNWQIDSGSTGALSIPGLLQQAAGTPLQYKVQYQDKWFRLTKNQTKGALAAVLLPYTLEIVDMYGNVLLNVPESAGLHDLYQAVQYQLSGVDSILDSLLSRRSGRI